MILKMITLLPLVTLAGLGAQYTEAEHLGNVLYCDRGQGLVYDRFTGPWVAIDVEEFEAGRYRCGDWITVYPEGWPAFSARVLDAGRLNSRTFRSGQQVIVDVPEYWATWQEPLPWVRVVNWSALLRKCGDLCS
jgi:hypothetical protein